LTCNTSIYALILIYL